MGCHQSAARHASLVATKRSTAAAVEAPYEKQQQSSCPSGHSVGSGSSAELSEQVVSLSSASSPCSPVTEPMLSSRAEDEEMLKDVGEEGRLCLLHHPTVKHLRRLQEEGCSCVVTLQKDEEGAQRIRKACSELGLRWVRLDFWMAYRQERREELFETADLVRRLLQQGTSVMVHCAAGIHRTGMFVYAVLRMLGHTPRSAVLSLKHLRETTYARVGAHRIQGIETLLSPVFPQPLDAPSFSISVEDLPPQAR